MNEYSANYRHEEVNPCAAMKCKERGIPMTIEDPDRKEHQDSTKGNWVYNHSLGIKLQVLLVSCPDTSNAYHQECHDLTAKHVTILIHVHQFKPVMEINEDATPKVENFWVDSILEKLHHQGKVDEGAEYLIQCLKVFALFHHLRFCSSLFKRIIIIGLTGKDVCLSALSKRPEYRLKRHALSVAAPSHSVLVQYQQSTESTGRGFPPHRSIVELTICLAA